MTEGHDTNGAELVDYDTGLDPWSKVGLAIVVFTFLASVTAIVGRMAGWW